MYTGGGEPGCIMREHNENIKECVCIERMGGVRMVEGTVPCSIERNLRLCQIWKLMAVSAIYC